MGKSQKKKQQVKGKRKEKKNNITQLGLDPEIDYTTREAATTLRHKILHYPFPSTAALLANNAYIDVCKVK